MNIVCSPCLFGDKNIEATGFCKNCEDPEPLCEFCAQMHIRQRATRNHEICTEIGKLTISQETSVEKYVCDDFIKVSGNLMQCESIRYIV